MRNKNAFATIGLFIFIFLALFAVIFIGINLFIYNQVTEGLSVDVNIGQVNLNETVSSTLGKMNTGFTDNADNIAIALLLGMSMFMILNAFFVGQKFPRVFFVVDILILIAVFIVSVYLSQAYEMIINTSTELNLFINDMPKASSMLLNLPAIVVTVGVLVMIFSYAMLPRSNQLGQSNEMAVYGYG
jgi:hypothetical protein